MTLTPEEQQTRPTIRRRNQKTIGSQFLDRGQNPRNTGLLPFTETPHEYMVLKNAGQPSHTTSSQDYVKGQGVIEFGLFLYWFKNPWGGPVPIQWHAESLLDRPRLGHGLLPASAFQAGSIHFPNTLKPMS
ncbi:MAG: hypothetical protein R2793_07055 [Flavobacteriaceae bacterium]